MVKSKNTSPAGLKQPRLKPPQEDLLRVVKATVALDPTRRLPYISGNAFPLSNDHLIPLIYYNEWRAVAINMILLGSVQMHLGCQGDDSDHSLLRVTPLPMPPAIPPFFQPTLLQQQIKHELWIDVFPLPALRDTLILVEGT